MRRATAPAPADRHGDLFAQLDGEMWLARRLEHQGYHVFMGSTDTEERKNRIRRAIVDRGAELVICGVRQGTKKPETYAQAFKRLYGEEL